MATCSMTGIVRNEGIEVTYCHYGGYLEGNGKVCFYTKIYFPKLGKYFKKIKLFLILWLFFQSEYGIM